MKIKNILIVLFMIGLMSSLVLAQGIPSQVREKYVRIEPPQGLEEAIVRVGNTSANETALNQLNQNLERFRERHENRICAGNCSIDFDQEGNNTRIVQRQQRRIGYQYINFPVNLEEEVVINPEGEVVRRSVSFWRFFLNFE